MDLNDVLAAYTALDDKRKALVIEKTNQVVKGMVWIPSPGPQTDGWFCAADELFYGGQAGGGKTDLELGLALGPHAHALILRRTNKEANGLVERITEILGSRDGFSSQVGIWRHEHRTIEIGGCQLEEDKQKYKGSPHDLICVGRGTPVLMADGSWRAVEKVHVGDNVATLEGPRRVNKAFPIPPRAAVELSVLTPQGRVKQIQSTTHRILTPSGWVAPGTRGASHHGWLRALASTSGPTPRIPPRGSLHRHESASPVRHSSSWWGRSSARLLALVARARCFACRRGWSAGRARPTPGSDCGASGGGPQEQPRQRRCSPLFPIQISPSAYSAFLFSWRQSEERVAADAPRSSLPPDSPGDCPAYSRSCGERTRGPLCSSPDEEGDPQSARPPIGAGRQTPMNSPVGYAAPTRTHSRYSEPYAHPYTRETRQSCFETSEYSWSVVPAGDVDLFDLEVEEVNHFITFGGIVNKNCFDEVSDFSETQYNFIIGWNRSADPKQRCRIVAAGNPPTRPEGWWVVKRWAAWLDPSHHKPAKPGELRWYTTGDDGREIEVDGRGPHTINGEQVMARSRTFIPAKLSDNPYLRDTTYAATLAALPIELRAAYRDGRFDIGLKDTPYQVIPTQWIREAQARWTPKPPPGVPQCAIAVDVAQGGDDETIMAIRHDAWYAPMDATPGKDTPDGPSVAGLVLSRRRDSARVIVDMGGGYGGSAFDHLKANGIDCTAYKGAEKTSARTADGTLGFANRRSAAIWKFREALDPGQPGGSDVALPPDPMLVADLTAPTFKPESRAIQVEDKMDVCKRLGRSTDRGDAVVMCWTSGLKNASVQGGFKAYAGRMPQVVTRKPR